MACKQGRAERRLLIQMHAVILPLLRVKGSNQQNHAPQLDALVASPPSPLNASLPYLPPQSMPDREATDTSSYIRSFDSTIERYLEACATCAQSSADQDDMQEEQLGGSSKVQVASCLREHRHTQEIVSICRLASEVQHLCFLLPVNISCASLRCLPPP